MLIYFNANKILQIDLDAFKEFKFNIIIFYIKDFNKKIQEGKWSTRNII